MLRIRYERLRLHWNQTTLSFRASVSVGDISRIETGRLRPYPSQIERLAAVLGVPSDELLQDVPSDAEEITPTAVTA